MVRIWSEYPLLNLRQRVPNLGMDEIGGFDDCKEVAKWANRLSMSGLMGVSNGMLSCLKNQCFISTLLIPRCLFRVLNQPLFLFSFLERSNDPMQMNLCYLTYFKVIYISNVKSSQS